MLHSHRALAFVTALSLSLSAWAQQTPVPPPSSAIDPGAHSGKSPRISRFVEVSPIIDSIEVRKGDPFIEVFVAGRAALDCFDVREYHIEKGEQSTRIIPRFSRTSADRVCRKPRKSFREKAADLDPANPASYTVEVLGYQGWQKKILKMDPTTIPQQVAIQTTPVAAPAQAAVPARAPAPAPRAAIPPRNANPATPPPRSDVSAPPHSQLSAPPQAPTPVTTP